jgi:tellurite resistance protein TerA
VPIDYNKRPSSGGDQPPAQPGGQPAGQPAAPPSGGGGVSLSKVTLTKSAPSVSLTKRGATGGQLRVNLQWSTGAAPQKKGLFGRLAGGAGGGGIDLDLACLWEFSDGSKGVVQALGNAFQAPNRGAPIIRLDGDDRSGSAAGGENMFIDLSRVNEIRRILVFAFIYEGVANWAAADGVVTLFPASGPEIEVRLDESDPGAPSCAIALLENKGGELTVRREVRYIRGGQDKVDEAYSWGMNWRAGRK